MFNRKTKIQLLPLLFVVAGASSLFLTGCSVEPINQRIREIIVFIVRGLTISAVGLSIIIFFANIMSLIVQYGFAGLDSMFTMQGLVTFAVRLFFIGLGLFVVLNTGNIVDSIVNLISSV